MLKWINKKRNTKGFTLVELVVVIAIIGILGAIAVPRFTNLRASSTVKADAATAAEIISAARIQEVDTGKEVKGLNGKGEVGDVGEDHKLKDEYMTVPAPQSVEPDGEGNLATTNIFTISKVEKKVDEKTEKKDLYTVTWIPNNAGKYNEEQTVIEGEPFKIKPE